MRINWKIVDQLLAITESTAQQLLDWMNDADVMDCVYPCSEGYEYLEKYSLIEADEFDSNEVAMEDFPDDDDTIEIYIPEIAEEVGIYDFWDDWRKDDQFRANMRRNFKRRYDL